MTTRERIAKLEKTVSRMEEAIFRLEGPKATTPGRLDQKQIEDLDTILYFIRTDQKISAIKAYRAMTGAGLREAYSAVMGADYGQ